MVTSSPSRRFSLSRSLGNTKMNDRLARLRERMVEAKLDGFLVGAPVEDIFHTYAANRRYLSGFTGSTGWLLVSGSHAFISCGLPLCRTSGERVSAVHCLSSDRRRRQMVREPRRRGWTRWQANRLRALRYYGRGVPGNQKGRGGYARSRSSKGPRRATS